MSKLLSNSYVLFHASEEKKYLCEYRHESETWSIEIYAKSFEDAEKRLKSLSNGKVLGEVKAKLAFPEGLLAKVAKRFRHVVS